MLFSDLIVLYQLKGNDIMTPKYENKIFPIYLIQLSNIELGQNN